MDGSEGPRAQSARADARNLGEAFALPVLLWDERWSTHSAEAAMISQDMSRARRAERIDSHAAAVILQAAIDALAGGGIYASSSFARSIRALSLSILLPDRSAPRHSASRAAAAPSRRD